MERSNTFIASIFLIFLLMTAVVPASAATFSFIDSSYLDHNDYLIKDNDGLTVANFTGDTTVTLNGGRSYTIDFRPRGLFDFSDQQPGKLTYPSDIITFFRSNLAGVVCLLGILFIAASWRGHS